MAADHRLPDRVLALPAVVAVGGVKVGEALGQKGVRHGAHLRDVDLAGLLGVQQGQAHHAKTKLVHIVSSSFSPGRTRALTAPIIQDLRRFCKEIPVYCASSKNLVVSGLVNPEADKNAAQAAQCFCCAVRALFSSC